MSYFKFPGFANKHTAFLEEPLSNKAVKLSGSVRKALRITLLWNMVPGPVFRVLNGVRFTQTVEFYHFLILPIH